MKKNEKNFIATGTLLINSVNEPVLSHDGAVIGYKTRKGIVRLAICLELERPDGTFEYLPTEPQMRTVGFDIFNYDKLEFIDGE